MSGGARRVVITGLGVVAPGALGRTQLWENAFSSRSFCEPIDRFDAGGCTCRVAGQVRDFHAAEFVPRNVIKQTDRSTHFALAACRMAMEDAGLVLGAAGGAAGGVDPLQVGMYFANVFGGMEFSEPELYAQTFIGPNRVSAYQAIAWFFAATQGQWSIATGIKGHGKSIVADRAGGHQALLLGARAIRHGHAQVMFVGGFEAPLVPYVFRIHQASGLLSAFRGKASLAYRPFEAERTGLVLGEGSGVLVLESLEHALRRGARPYAEVAGGAMGFDPSPEGPRRPDALARCLAAALDDAGALPGDVDHVLPEGLAVPAADDREAIAIHRVLGEHRRAAVSVPKAKIGHCLAAAGSLDAIWAALMLSEERDLPALPPERVAAPVPLGVTPPPGRAPRAVLLSGTGEGGVVTAVLLRALQRGEA
jgi:3-oxoacyl-(acyl-carrier-protein) synthase